MVKMSTTIGILLLVTFFFFAFGFLIDDFETNYIDTGISSASPFSDDRISNFNDTEFIAEKLEPIKQGFDDLATEGGFFDKIQDLAVVVPIAIIKIPSIMFILFERGIARMIEILNIIGIPVEVIAIASAALFIFIIFKLVAFWRRTPV